MGRTTQPGDSYFVKERHIKTLTQKGGLFYARRRAAHDTAEVGGDAIATQYAIPSQANLAPYESAIFKYSAELNRETRSALRSKVDSPVNYQSEKGAQAPSPL